MATSRICYSQVLLTYPQCSKSKEELLEYIQSIENIQCAIVAKENHNETEGEHLHAWIKFRHQMKIAGSKWGHLFDWEGIHGNYQRVMVTQRSVADTVKYVMKDGDTLVWNCDPEEIMKASKSKGRKYDNKVLLETPNEVLVEKGIIPLSQLMTIKKAKEIYALLKQPKDKLNVRGIWLHGKAGCGKSTLARKMAKELFEGYYEKPQNKWFDGYAGEKCIILDDLDTTQLFHHIKIWADRYACKGEIKGSTVWLKHDMLIITSNWSIDEICDQAVDGHKYRDALKRRFTEITVQPGEKYISLPDGFTYDNPDVDDDYYLKLATEPPTKKDPSQDLSNTLLGSGY
ncbi:replication associated protein [Chimpanzee faeces associated circular DNA molecule 1]|uniref:replication associated protein n=1 Tax=Chimpanzee faeces associated circular DNA molecule 1 TaxID=1676185 RepID=UPI0007FB67D8|nr:replication associated protein [Chimpanzee faeces associated circular DNA molecule 1]AKO71485.1 replication associated protein [Chimpanzee faeces associated circular DNA molecule 1]